jgi:hypothetical protein
LQATLESGPTADLAFNCGAHGKPYTKESFGNEFKSACRQAGVNQLMAVFGWKDSKMAAHYVREANRKKLSRQAFEKLSGTKSPAPLHGAGKKVE